MITGIAIIIVMLAEMSALGSIQCVALDSSSLIIYPEIKATEVPF